MPFIHNYEVYIFDCDGVIMDSNDLKIDAMKLSLVSVGAENHEIQECLTYFRNNFGKSRFHHVQIFVDKILSVDIEFKENTKNKILSNYSEQCRNLYKSAELTEGFIDFISSVDGEKYVASGSEQNELRDVFDSRNLSKLFNGIFGSPDKKKDIVSNILKGNSNAVMFGDAISDLEAAKDNNIDFIAYLPLSNVRDELISISKKNNYKILEHWGDLI